MSQKNSYRKSTLSTSHYAGKWAIPDEDQRYNLKEVNALGYQYAILPDSPEKEQRLLEILEKFHGYLMKYVIMIVRGTIPPVHTRAGKDAKELLRQLTPRSMPKTKESVEATCKMLHLAFKGASTEDIYDTLAFCFMRAARKYDPHYANKTHRVCEEIHALHKEFTPAEVEERVGYDCTGILRSLVRKGYLSSITAKKKVIAYKIGQTWPVPQSFFESGPVGFVYMLQMWFRYYLNDHVLQQMSELESTEGVFQLGPDGRNADQADWSSEFVAQHREGNCVSSDGKFRFMADRSLMDMPLDISAIDLDWVSATDDKLFRDLDVNQRAMLYMVFYEELTWKRIAQVNSCDVSTAKSRFNEIIEKIRSIGKIEVAG